MAKKLIQLFLNIFYPLFKKIFPYDFYAYLAVGAANTVLNIALFACTYWLISHATSLHFVGINLKAFAVELATIISFLTTVATGFWLSKNFVFTSASNEKNEKAKQFGKYFYVSLQGQFSDYLITKGLIIFVLVKPIAAYFISTFIMLMINYFLQKYFTFKSKRVS